LPEGSRKMSSDSGKQKNQSSGVKDFAAGAFGGVCQLAVGHPLDTMKVKLQAGGQYSGLADVFKQTLKRDGVAGFYRGVASPLIGFMGLNAILFAAYGSATRFVRSGLDEKTPTPYTGILLAGGFAGINAALVEGPMDLFKAKMQAQVPRADGTLQYKSTFDCVRQISATYGIKGVYQGFVPTLIRNTFCNATYFLGYEWTKRTFTTGPEPSGAVLLLAGGVAGMCYWILYPFDIVKTILQTDKSDRSQRTYTGYADCVRKVYARAGLKGFFVGFAPCMLRSFPANAACFYGYEVAKQALNSI